MSPSSVFSTPQQCLKQYWGYDEFLPIQLDAIQATLNGQDSLVILPTGGGKSVCYQIPALCWEGLTVVVSPLIALMKDQVDALRGMGISAGALNSSISAIEQERISGELERGNLRLLYVAPERLLTERLIELLKRTPPKSFAIDEAHCISSWGHDFRREYRMLATLKDHFPQTPLAAFTATATREVQIDIAAQLKLQQPAIFVGNFHRPNLHYCVQRRQSGFNQLCSVIDRFRNQSGIIYAISRMEVERISDALNRLGYRSRPYHAKLSDAHKKNNQEAFEHDEIEVMVATIAFGMGIDKSNVRYVIHYEIPRSIENYSQESGRAGRDGLPAECWLFHSPRDRRTWENIIQNSDPEHRQRSLAALRSVNHYCRSRNCRHQFLVEFFGQTFETQCQACDICLNQQTLVADPLRIGQIILSCVHRCQQKFGADHISKVLHGGLDQKVVQHGHEKLSTWGLLKEHRKIQIRDWIDQLLLQEFLIQAGEYHVLTITPTGRALLRGEVTPRLTQLQPFTGPQTSNRTFDSWEGVDRELCEQLRVVRRQIADRSGLAAFIVFSDATLRDLARRRPTRLETLLAVHGIGQRKAADYGEQMMTVIAQWCQAHNLENDVAVAPQATIRSQTQGQRSLTVNRNASSAFPLFDEGLPIGQIAEKMARAPSTIWAYLMDYISERKITDPSRWVEPEWSEKIAIAIQYNDTGRLRPLYEALHGKVSYDQIRVVMECQRVAKDLAQSS